MKWYIVHTRPRWEKKVHNSLMIKGIQSFCPINKVHRQWSDRIKVIEVPLFTGHVFVKICNEDRTRVRMTAGVRNIVYADGKASVLKEKEVDCIRKFSENYYNIKLLKHSLKQHNGLITDAFANIPDHEASVGDTNMTILKLERLGFVLFADRKYSLVPNSLDKIK